MRIAVLIISLIAFLVIALQSCAMGVGAALDTTHGFRDGAVAGGALAFLFVFGAAVVMAVPLVSAACFALGAVVAIPAGSSTTYKDLIVWGSLSAGLALLSLWGYREKRRKAAPLPTPAD
jgi:hypothetical protein